MKKDLYIALTSIVIFTLMNAIGGLINDSLGYYYGLDQVLESIPLFLIFGLFYWLSSLLKIKLRKSLRLPVIRTLFWALISIPIFTSGSNTMASGDFIDAVIPTFCFLTNTIGLLLKDIAWLGEIRFVLWGILILGVSIYQIVILEISTLIINKITANNKVYSA
jgi:hypothetical protein